MLDAIAAIDELGMDAAVDVPATGLETPLTDPIQGSSIQETDLSQSLLDMMSSLNASAANASAADPLADNSSLRLVSDQSVADALADSIPGLDPTTLPAALQESPDLAQNMMNAIAQMDNPDTLGEAFQTVSDGFEGLSKSFELLAATFLMQDGDPNTVAIGTEGDDTNADLKISNSAIGTEVDNSDAASKIASSAIGTETDDADLDAEKGAIGGDVANAGLDVEKGVASSKAKGADLDIEKMFGNTDFDLDFDALKLNVAQVSKGLQFLVEQLEAAFEGDDVMMTGTANA
jgi:hypothetical protein